VLISFLKLIKYRLSAAVTFSAAAGFIICDCEFHWWRFPAMITGVYLLAGGSSALNQYQERERDRLMTRTANRPIPAGKLKAEVALIIALIMIAAGLFVLLLFSGKAPALLGLFNIVLYNLVYTPLKKQSWLALLPGALVGAVPPMIGFTAAGGEIFHSQAIFLSLFMFIWQLPHFWLLQIAYNNDYNAGGFAEFIRFPQSKTKSTAIFSSVVLIATLVMFAELFGISAGPGIFRFLRSITIALIVSFALLLNVFTTRQDINYPAAPLIKILNLYSFLVLVILMASSYCWLQP